MKDLNILKLASIEREKSVQFLGQIDSKLLMDVSKSRVTENNEWIDMVEFTMPYLEKALTKQIKNIVTEEEIIKIELIKKVTVESVKHLAKNVNLVDRYNQQSGEVVPKKILNAYKEETFLTYENRFLYTLIKLIEDFIYLREKQSPNEYKGKNYQKANYEASIKLKKGSRTMRKTWKKLAAMAVTASMVICGGAMGVSAATEEEPEKVNVNVEYNSEVLTGIRKKDGSAERIADIKKKLKVLKQTDVYVTLVSKKATYVKAPLKMTNVLLKNVNFQYAVKLWNYLSEQIELNDKITNESSEFEEKGMVKKLLDEDIFLMHSIFKSTDLENQFKGKAKAAIEDKKVTKELTDALIEKIIELNPDMSEKDINKLITDKLLVMKTRKLISLKPIEDKFKEKIDKYMANAKEVRLK